MRKFWTVACLLSGCATTEPPLLRPLDDPGSRVCALCGAIDFVTVTNDIQPGGVVRATVSKTEAAREINSVLRDRWPRSPDNDRVYHLEIKRLEFHSTPIGVTMNASGRFQVTLLDPSTPVWQKQFECQGQAGLDEVLLSSPARNRAAVGDCLDQLTRDLVHALQATNR